MTTEINNETNGDNQVAEGSQQTAEATPPSFVDTLPEEYRTDPVFKSIKSLEDLAKSYQHASKFTGMDKNEIARKPKSDAPEAEWEAFYDFIGRPKEMTAYQLPKISDDLGFDPNFEKAFREVGYKSGLTEKQFGNIAGFFAAVQKNIIDNTDKQQKEMAEKTVQTLKNEWGSAFEERSRDADNFIRHYGGDELKKALGDSGALSNPAIAKAFANAGKSLREHQGFSGDGGFSGALTPNEAKMRINEKRSDTEFMKKYNSGDVAAINEMKILYEYANPKKEARG